MLVVPDKMSREKIFNLKAMGAQVVLTRSRRRQGPSRLLPGHGRAHRAAKRPGAYFINQFGNPGQPGRARSTAPARRSCEQMDGDLDAIVFGCGSSGTMTGLSRCFAQKSPHDRAGARRPGRLDPRGVHQRGTLSDKSASWMVEGIGEDFLPPISDFTRVKKAYAITDKESFLTARELLEKEGILGGSSTGTLLAAALKYCREQTTPKKVLVFVCDTGNKYLSKMYNDYWMLDNGFLEREQHGDLRDLILRPYSQRDTVVVGADRPAGHRLPAHEAVRRLAAAGDGRRPHRRHRRRDRDVLLHVYGDEARFRDPVSTAMVSKLDKLDVSSPIESLLPVFDRGHVAIVDGRRAVPRPDHPHRPAELPAPPRAVMNASVAEHWLPGDRLPNVRLRAGSGESVTLHAEFAGAPLWLATPSTPVGRRGAAACRRLA